MANILVSEYTRIRLYGLKSPLLWLFSVFRHPFTGKFLSFGDLGWGTTNIDQFGEKSSSCDIHTVSQVLMVGSGDLFWGLIDYY